MAAVHTHGLGDLALDFAVEIVTGNVQLGGTHLGHGAVKHATRELGHALGVADMALVLGELLEHGQLIGFLEAAQAHAHGAGFGGDDHHGAVGPESGGDAGHAVADAGAVLTDDHTVATRNAGVAVGHMGRALLVDNGDQANASRGKNIHGIHEGRAHDAEHLADAVGNTGFHECFRGGHLLNAFDHLTIICCSHLCLLC